MGSGISGIGNNSFSKQAAENVKGVNGYNVVSSDGTKLEFFFRLWMVKLITVIV